MSNKHKHYEMIVAKAANADLVQLIKMDGNWENAGLSDKFISFSEEYDYFLCLPQHKEACLHWLNATNDTIEWSLNSKYMKAIYVYDTEPGAEHLTNNCGVLTIIKYTNTRNVLVKFKDPGYETTAQMDSIRKGNVKDPYALTVYGVGFIGEGEASRDENGHTKAYQVWHSMMARCYNEDHAQYHNYGGRGVRVHSDWHNFQSFAKWFDENYEKGKELDKDKLTGKSHGDIYSEHWCCFIAPSENTATSQAKEYIVRNPKGEEIAFTNMRAFCRINSLDRSALSKVIKGEVSQHKGWTRIKPKKEKRWIAFNHENGNVYGTFISEDKCKMAWPNLQKFQIEVEV